MKAETIILGNVITMDEFKPYAVKRRIEGGGACELKSA